MVGLQGLVVDVRPFGCFIQFDVEVEGGDKHKVYGMVHVSEMSWDYTVDARLRVKVNSLCCHLCVLVLKSTILLTPQCDCAKGGPWVQDQIGRALSTMY